VPAHGVDFVDEDDARRILLALCEEVAHPRSPDPDEHLDEIRTGDREERHARFTRDRPSEQRLAGTRRTDEQHALRDATAEPGELLRLLEEVDDLLEFGLAFLDSRDVFEGHAILVLGQQASLRLSETHRLAATGLHLADEEQPEPDEEHERKPHDQDLAPEAPLVSRFRFRADPLILELGEELVGDGGRRRIGRELAAVDVLAGDVALFDGDRRMGIAR